MSKKIHELAKELGMKSRDVVEKAQEIGLSVKTHSSAISPDDEKKLRAAIGADSEAEKVDKGDKGESTEIGKGLMATIVSPQKQALGGLQAKAVVSDDYFNSNRKAMEEKRKEAQMLSQKQSNSKAVVKEDKVAKAGTLEKEPVAETRQNEENKTPVEKKNDETTKAGSDVKKTDTAHVDVQKGSQKNIEKEKIADTHKNAQAIETASENKTNASAKEIKGEATTKATHKVQLDKENDSKKHVAHNANDKGKEKTLKAKSKEEKLRKALDEIKVQKEEEKLQGIRKVDPSQVFARDNEGRPVIAGVNILKKAVKKKKPEDIDRNKNNDTRKHDSKHDKTKSSGSKERNSDKKEGYANRNKKSHDDRRRDDAVAMETKPSYSKRDDKKKKQKGDNRKSKFEKLESRNKLKSLDGYSLEKKSRKKYKNKPQVEEAPAIEETLPEGTIVVNVPITVAGFCEQAEVSQAQVIMTLMKMGIMANINQNIDEDTLAVLADELGIEVVIGNVEADEIEEGIELHEDSEEELRHRPPIITVMGHVDHGKTSLLDAIRKTNVTASESGGITQHIGASEVEINGEKIVFLDTPGHEAFTAMRARGAHVTDIAVLVVAADDSVKPQTIESISHAKAAGVPMIVAINKMDKPGANPDRVKTDLSEHGVLVEDWGGDVISVPVSAKTGDGIVNLLEMILLQAEVLELKANPNRLALGSVIEARLDKSKGPVATLLVTNGTLKSGDSVVAGTCSGRIRLMTDYKGDTIKEAPPATAVEILGLTEVPQAGDEFNALKDDKQAREIAETRKMKLREEVLAKNAGTTLEKLFSQIQEGDVKELNLIIKGDVQGSVGALVASLEKLNSSEVKVNVVHTGVGTVTESDVMLAGTTNSIIIGFNVRPSTAVTTLADREGIEIRTYRVIYDVIDDVENAMKGLLDPEFKEEVLGKVEIRNTFKVPGVGIIGGAYVTEGKIIRNAQVRLVRDGILIHEGKISSLKRFKDDVKEVNSGYECGIGIEDYNDIKEGDLIECFHMVEVERS